MFILSLIDWLILKFVSFQIRIQIRSSHWMSSLLSGMTICSRPCLYPSCPRSGINHFSKLCWEVVFQDSLECLLWLFWDFFSGQSYFKFRTTRKYICGNMNTHHSNSWLQGFHLTSTSISPLFHTEKTGSHGYKRWYLKIFHNYSFYLSHNTHIGQSHNNSINTIMMHKIIEDTCVCQASWKNLVNF